MRKFTKEILAMLTATTVGTSAGIYSYTEVLASENIWETNTEATTELLAGATMQPSTESSVGVDMPYPSEDADIAGALATEPTEEEFPPTAGVPMPPDYLIEETTESTEEDFPPLEGELVESNGDVNLDGKITVSDVIIVQKWLLHKLDESSSTVYYYIFAADVNYDGTVDAFDLAAMKQKLVYPEMQ